MKPNVDTNALSRLTWRTITRETLGCTSLQEDESGLDLSKNGMALDLSRLREC